MVRLDSMFDIRYGHSLELNRLAIANQSDGFPFVSRKMGDNGVAAYVARVPGIDPNPAGELTVALSGNGVLSTFIQEQAYYTAYHIACLRPKIKLSKAQLLYYCACIKANRYRYSFGRQANRTLKSLRIPAPSMIPSWVDDANIGQLIGKGAPAMARSTPKLDTKKWARFKLSELFELKKGRRLTKAKMVPGATPFIGAIDNNNGLTNLVAQPPLHPANTITVNYNGNGVAEAFFQPLPYRCSDDVNVLYPKANISPYAALFIAAVIREEKYRFNYGRKWHLERMEQSEIRLPARSDGRPDWRFMEKYIKTLPFSSVIYPG